MRRLRVQPIPVWPRDQASIHVGHVHGEHCFNAIQFRIPVLLGNQSQISFVFASQVQWKQELNVPAIPMGYGKLVISNNFFFEQFD